MVSPILGPPSTDLFPAGCLDFITAWSLGLKRENSKITKAYEIPVCITLANVSFAKASHYQTQIQCGKAQHKSKNPQRHASWEATNAKNGPS